MLPLQAAALWIGIHVLFLIFISSRVGAARIKHKVNLGDGENPEVFKAIRAQGNYIEYAPLAMIGLLTLAQLGAGALIIHVLGGLFFTGRFAHYLGLGAGILKQGRLIGTILTMLGLMLIGGYLIFRAFL